METQASITLRFRNRTTILLLEVLPSDTFSQIKTRLLPRIASTDIKFILLKDQKTQAGEGDTIKGNTIEMEATVASVGLKNEMAVLYVEWITAEGNSLSTPRSLSVDCTTISR
jgi:hypothetical protein